ncbi:hypothetical protein N7462_008730 [Penicillium macrosclerotiorum]|uniref:uncharacterized protein n=1 Tax=Penicillium macrosclerotiorum TaxID=303699 RepID=UPI0025490C8B|nr:uncharacterized protein N7462_008730 [Penicillium macrosclerotiorum]KAJ5675833.1 hypothetical protein N7462_008730 [Penicillium macrosclerotiorum]
MLFQHTARFLGRPAHLSGHLTAAVSRRSWASTPARFNAAQNPSAYREGMSRYNFFARPFGKVFLGAVLTYQIIYWTWLKLEMDESKLEKNEEITSLEKQARELAAAQQK